MNWGKHVESGLIYDGHSICARKCVIKVASPPSQGSEKMWGRAKP